MKKLYINFLKSIRSRRERNDKPVHLDQYRYVKVMKIRRRARSGEAWDF